MSRLRTEKIEKLRFFFANSKDSKTQKLTKLRLRTDRESVHPRKKKRFAGDILGKG